MSRSNGPRPSWSLYTPMQVVGILVAVVVIACILPAIYFVTKAYGEGEMGWILPFIERVILEMGPGLVIVEMVLLILLGIAMTWAVRKAVVSPRGTSALWKEIGKSYGWRYSFTILIPEDAALMFRQGHSRRAGHTLSGSMQELPFRMFEYQFLTGDGDRANTYAYTVYEITFAGAFPHLYLDSRNGYTATYPGLQVLKPVPLPSEFEAAFTLRAPEQYEVEALAIFTPDTLAYFIDSSWKFDVELVGRKMYIFSYPRIASVKDFYSQIDKVTKVVEHMRMNLDRSSFVPIGNLPYKI